MKRPVAPRWGRLPTIVFVALCAMGTTALAQPKGKADKNDTSKSDTTSPSAREKADKKAPAPKSPAGGGGGGKHDQELVIGGMNLSGHNRTPQLLYFLERANEELERASLEKRSFIPHMVRSIEEEQL
jgi:hypothetical protein